MLKNPISLHQLQGKIMLIIIGKKGIYVSYSFWLSAVVLEHSSTLKVTSNKTGSSILTLVHPPSTSTCNKIRWFEGPLNVVKNISTSYNRRRSLFVQKNLPLGS